MDPVEVTYTSLEELQRDMGNLDPAIMCIRNTLVGKGVPAGWQLKDISKRSLSELLGVAYKNWPGSVKLTFEAPPEPDEFEGLSPRAMETLKFINAAHHGDVDTVKRLLPVSADPDMRIKEKGNNTALNLAARSGHIEIMRFLLDRRATPDCRNDFEETPLMCAANRARADVCRLLLEHGADANALDENGDNSLDFLGVGNSDRKKDCRELLRRAGCHRR